MALSTSPLPAGSAEAAPPGEAACAVHRDQPAVAACARCGRFVCRECNQGLECPECARLALNAIPDGAGRARLASGLLWANVATALLGALLSLGRAEHPLVALGLVFAGLATLVVLLLTAIFYLRWLHLAVRSSAALGVEPGATPGMAVGCFFIPFLNFYRPHQVVKAMAQGLGGRAGSAPVDGWWASWIAGNVISQVQARLELGTSGGPNAILEVVSAAFTVVAAVLCIRVIGAIQGELSEQRSRALRAPGVE